MKESEFEPVKARDTAFGSNPQVPVMRLKYGMDAVLWEAVFGGPYLMAIVG
jgi:hypothetical protein